MNSLYDFIVEPIGEKYSNTVKVDNKDLIINTKIENWIFVNRLARVIKKPLAFNMGIEEGDMVVIHQNVFRTFYDMKGNKKKSRSYFKDNFYFCSLDQVYLYKNNTGWNTVGDRCFIKPIKNRSFMASEITEPLIGIVKYDNTVLNDLGITNGMIVGFKPDSEFEFVVDGELLYCMKSNNIVIKHEYQGDEEEYNPSWASSS